eukprot:Nk52_evm30s311 gene=Nk52_evmTU30s311
MEWSSFIVIVLIFLSGGGAAVVKASTTVDDVTALSDFYNGTSSWVTNTNWNDTLDPCDDNWFGVTCACTGGNCVVSGLELKNNSINGEIPNSFGLLKEMLNLDLSGNFIQGSVPNIVNMTKLKTLNLSFNLFTGGPPVINETSTLTMLDMSNNHLTGNLSSVLTSHNTQVTLSCNRFTCPVDAVIAGQYGIDECICEAGRQVVYSDISNYSCKSCPSKTMSPYIYFSSSTRNGCGNSTSNFGPDAAAYYAVRYTQVSSQTVKSAEGNIDQCIDCFFPLQCMGGACRAGASGSTCEQCEGGQEYFRNGSTCLECKGIPWQSIYGAGLLLLVFFPIRIHGLSWSIATKVKQICNFLQIYVFTMAIPVLWPERMLDLSSYVAIVNLNLKGLAPDCLFDSKYVYVYLSVFCPLMLLFVGWWFSDKWFALKIMLHRKDVTTVINDSRTIKNRKMVLGDTPLKDEESLFPSKKTEERATSKAGSKKNNQVAPAIDNDELFNISKTEDEDGKEEEKDEEKEDEQKEQEKVEEKVEEKEKQKEKKNESVTEEQMGFEMVCRLRNQTRRGTWLFVSLLYAPITAMAVKSFMCSNSSSWELLPVTSASSTPAVPLEDNLYLWDSSESCSSATFKFFQFISGASLFFVTFALPLAIGFWTLRLRKWGLLNNYWAKHGAVYESYSPRIIFLEAFMLLRKAALVIAVAATPEQAEFQLSFALALTGLYFLIVLLTKPFYSRWKCGYFHNIYELITTVALGLNQGYGLTLVDKPNDWGYDSSGFNFVMLVGNLSVLALGIVLLWVGVVMDPYDPKAEPLEDGTTYFDYYTSEDMEKASKAGASESSGILDFIKGLKPNWITASAPQTSPAQFTAQFKNRLQALNF